jgi:chromosome segregation ATPase
MKKLIALLIAGALPALGSLGTAAAQEPPPADPSALLLQEVTELNASMREIADLLRQAVDRQQTALLLQRLQQKSRGMGPLEEALREARSEQENVATNLAQLEQHFEFVEERRREAEERQGLLAEDPNMEMQERQMTLERNLLEEKLASLNQRIFDLENDVLNRQSEIRDWEEFLDDRLGLP